MTGTNATLLFALLVGAAGSAAADPSLCRAPRGTGSIRVACLGDSNTHSRWQSGRPGGFPAEESWCERLGDAVITSINCGWSGATASWNRIPEPRFQAGDQLDAAVREGPLDVVILALGTNDLGFLLSNSDFLLVPDPTPAAIADALAALAAATALPCSGLSCRDRFWRDGSGSRSAPLIAAAF